jgi:hypothetical protein
MNEETFQLNRNLERIASSLEKIIIILENTL